MITKRTSLKKTLELGKECKGCGHCCSFTSGTVLDEDSERIAKHFGITKQEFEEKYTVEQEKFNTKRRRFKQKKDGKPYGPCIFLKDKKCMIHEVKPVHCRVGNCSKHGEQLSIWYMFKYFVNKDDPESVRQYAIYCKTHPTLKGAELNALIPDKKKLKQILNFEVEKNGKNNRN